MLKIWVATLVAVTGLVNGVTVTIPERSVNTTVGGNITVPCTYETTSAPSIIQWNFYSVKHRNRSGVYLWQAGKAYYVGRFKGRTQVADQMGNATLSVSNMQPQDTGVYTCIVFNPNDTNLENEKSVTVSVLVPPSKPLCSFGHNHHQNIEIGHFVTLSCFSEIGLPVPTYKWHKLVGDTVEPVTEPYSFQTGQLIIGNLTKFEEGYYQCTATNVLGNSTCHVDLTVKHSESGVIVGALIAAILAAALICVIAWILTSREREKRQKGKATISETQTMSPNAEHSSVPSQSSVPTAAVPPSKESNEAGEDTPPEECVAFVPEHETQDTEHQPVS